MRSRRDSYEGSVAGSCFASEYGSSFRTRTASDAYESISCGDAACSDFGENEGPIGTLQADWIKTFTQGPKKKGAPDPKPKVGSLPAHLVPVIKWEALPVTFGSLRPFGRQGHVLARVARAAEKRPSPSNRDPSELFYVLGGGCGHPPEKSTKKEAPSGEVVSRTSAISRVLRRSKNKDEMIGRVAASPPRKDRKAIQAAAGGEKSNLIGVVQMQKHMTTKAQIAPLIDQLEEQQQLKQQARRKAVLPSALSLELPVLPGHDTFSSAPSDSPTPRSPRDGIVSTTIRLPPAKSRGCHGLLTGVGPSAFRLIHARAAARGPGDEKQNLTDPWTWQGVSGGSADGVQAQAEWHTAAPAELPQRLISCTACVLSGGHRVVVFGGIELLPAWASLPELGSTCDARRADVPPIRLSSSLHILEVLEGRWRDESAAQDGPPPCFEHAAAAAEGGRGMFVHGGRTYADPSGDESYSLYGLGPWSWLIDGQEDMVVEPTNSARYLEVTDRSARWKTVQCYHYEPDSLSLAEHQVAFTQPPLRHAHSIVMDVGKAYLFGGIDGDGMFSTDIRILSLEHGDWLAVEAEGTTPVPRAYHTAALLGPYMAIFGGISNDGSVLKDLRLLHLPTLMWSAPKYAETIGEPPARAAHAVSTFDVGTRPGQMAMLVFGGCGRSGEMLNDMYVVMVKTPTPPADLHLQKNAHSDIAVRYASSQVLGNLEKVQDEFSDQMQDSKYTQQDMVQEVRNTKTRCRAAQLSQGQFERKAAVVESRENEIVETLEEEESALNDSRNEATRRLRELEIEMDSLRAKIDRLQSEQENVASALIDTEDVEILVGFNRNAKREIAPLSFVRNPWCPRGEVERYQAQWHGAAAVVDVIVIEPSEKDRALSPGSARLKRSNSRAPSPDSTDRWLIWTSALSRELRIMKVLRHPNLQEVYGAAADLSDGRLLLLVQPLTRTLVDLFRDSLNATGAASTVDAQAAPPDGAGEVGLSENERLCLSCDITSALDYLHSLGVAHRHVVPENVFISRTLGICGKLGGYFAARVSCRARKEDLVLGKQSGLPPSLLAEAGILKEKTNKALKALAPVDARPADVLALGLLLLRIWNLQKWANEVEADRLAAGAAADQRERTSSAMTDTSSLGEADACPSRRASSRKGTATSERGGGSARHRGEAVLPIWQAKADEIKGVRDNGVRFVINCCLKPQEEGRFPSARTIHAAFVELQSHEIQALPIVNPDPSRDATIVDLAVEDEAMEDLLEAQQSSYTPLSSLHSPRTSGRAPSRPTS